MEVPQGTGSGFVWDTEGNIVTNYHVIEKANELQVTLADRSSFKAVVVGAEPDKDLIHPFLISRQKLCVIDSRVGEFL